MKADHDDLKGKLREAGLSAPLIDAVWPTWWSEEAYGSESARAQLRFSVARKIGLSPTSLIDDRVEYLWKDDARFKHLSNETESQKSALTSFGASVSNLLHAEKKNVDSIPNLTASELREMILLNRAFVDLPSLLSLCWAIGIPVVHLRIFPLEAKRMHAMAVFLHGSYSILLGRDSMYPAPIAFTLAHEIGHIMLGHLKTTTAIVDFENSDISEERDLEETQADRYALELLTGKSDPQIYSNLPKFNAAQLADSVLTAAHTQRIEPGTLALCLAYNLKIWPIANAALQYIYDSPKPVWKEVNRIAFDEIDFSYLSSDNTDFLAKILGLPNE